MIFETKCIWLFKNLSFIRILFCVASSRVSLASNYSIDTIPPTNDGSPLLLEVNIYLRSIFDVQETKQQIRWDIIKDNHNEVKPWFSLEIILRSFWKDTRIKAIEKYMKVSDEIGKYVNLGPSGPAWTGTIWMPDIFIMHAIQIRAPTYLFEPSSIR